MCYVLSMTVRLLLLLSAELSCAIAQEREAEKTAMEEPPVLLSYKSPDGEIPIASKEDGYVSYDELSARKSADPNVSDQPENLGETTAPENQFLKFWENNTCLLKLRTTDGMFNNCTWFRRDHVVNSSVKLTRCSYFQNHQYGRETGKENWKMGKDNSATFLDGFDYTVKKLLYQDEGGNCAVFMYRDFMNADEGLKESLEEECKTEKGFDRCIAGGISALIDNHKLSSSAGTDEITSKLLKNTKCISAMYLTMLFSQSLSSGILPDEWKKSKVVPVYKSGHPLNVARPGARTVAFSSSFFLRTAKDWNGLPNNIAAITASPAFIEELTSLFCGQL